MLWYLFQTAIIVWIVNFYEALDTHEPMLDILMIAFFVAYVTTWIISRLLDLLHWLFTWGSLPTNPLLSQQSRSYPRIHVSQHTLTGRVAKDRRHK
jgi:hypothetical protein